jgi:hypothetical protein
MIMLMLPGNPRVVYHIEERKEEAAPSNCSSKGVAFYEYHDA